MITRSQLQNHSSDESDEEMSVCRAAAESMDEWRQRLSSHTRELEEDSSGNLVPHRIVSLLYTSHFNPGPKILHLLWLTM